MMALPYTTPRITETRTLRPAHVADLSQSRVDFITAGLAGLRSASHATAYDAGLRGQGSLDGLLIPYWQPAERRFSPRFLRVKPDVAVAGRKYLQPVGERPRLYFIPGTSLAELDNTHLVVLITEGEKKSLSLDRARLELGIDAVVIGIGGVWSWRTTPKELQPDGSLGKGRSSAIADLDLIRWAGRKVYVIFDSDAATNWKVVAAETALARELAGRGANVFIVRLPGGSTWLKSA